MRAFSQASKADFNELDNILSDGQLHVYKNRELPPGCVPGMVRIGFEKNGEIYTLYVDKGVSTSIKNNDFSFWLEKGEMRFVGIDDLISFFYSTAALFTESIGPNSRGTLTRSNTNIGTTDIVNRQKVRDLKEEHVQLPEVWPEQISNALKQEIFGQDDAIDSLSEGIAINMMKKDEKIYVALFLGPPASGKTETGSILAKVLTKLYGREYGFIKIDANTYKQEHMIHNILGAPPSYIGYGEKTVLDPIRSNPYHVILLDEVEKSHEDLLVALMEALDTGHLSMADNSPDIDLNKCILLFTSNISVDISAYDKASEFEKEEMCKDIFTEHCGRPEISRRIKDFMVFKTISEDAEIDVIIKFMKRALKNYGAELEYIDEKLMVDFLNRKTKYGASEIANRVEKAIGRAIMKAHNRNYINGKRILVKGHPENIELEVV